MLAVVLANIAIFAPQKAEGQKTIEIFIDNMGSDTNREYKMTQFTIGIFHFTICEGDGFGCIPSVPVS